MQLPQYGADRGENPAAQAQEGVPGAGLQRDLPAGDPDAVPQPHFPRAARLRNRRGGRGDLDKTRVEPDAGGSGADSGAAAFTLAPPSCRQHRARPLPAQYVLRRMLELGKIDQAQHDAAMEETLTNRLYGPIIELDAPYVAEMVRAEMLASTGPRR